MNYRHAFHAGNFADLVKHAAVLWLMDRLTRDPRPLLVVDTHAGAGEYDLTSEDQVRSKEAEAGIGRLMGQGAPVSLQPLARSVSRRNSGSGPRIYPGSPALILQGLRAQDRYLGCELNPDVVPALRALVGRDAAAATALMVDGYDQAGVEAGRAEPGQRLFVLIDPPFERADDYARAAEAMRAVLGRRSDAVVAVWLPLKDLETLDGFVRRLEDGGRVRALIAEARLRPLLDPMRMNGCALVVAGAPEGAEAALERICADVVEALGEPGGAAKVWSIG
ncbi:MAG TPA: 23S rRNA (adenine(2030)-N(6))-methyltransferase RlmJ [Caulobacteraceae bacterium]|jgi:23S rRNA (adenine2030-N6)-methyltransferase